MNKAYYIGAHPPSSFFGSRTSFPDDEESRVRRAAPVSPAATKPRRSAEAPVLRRGRSAAPHQHSGGFATRTEPAAREVNGLPDGWPSPSTAENVHYEMMRELA